MIVPGGGGERLGRPPGLSSEVRPAARHDCPSDGEASRRTHDPQAGDIDGDRSGFRVDLTTDTEWTAAEMLSAGRDDDP